MLGKFTQIIFHFQRRQKVSSILKQYFFSFLILKYMIEFFYLYNMYYGGFSNDFFIQLTHLILVAKDRSLKISTEDDIAKWDENNFYAHSILLSQFTCKLLHNSGLNNNIILDFIKFKSK